MIPKELYIEPFSFIPLHKEDEIEQFICDVFNNKVLQITFNQMISGNIHFIHEIDRWGIHHNSIYNKSTNKLALSSLVIYEPLNIKKFKDDKIREYGEWFKKNHLKIL